MKSERGCCVINSRSMTVRQKLSLELAKVHVDCLTVHVDARVPLVSAVKSDLGTWTDTSLQVNIIIHVKARITILTMSGV